eukprot:TRINITY_DN2331_c0_g2_i2.p1 TRINITY_DN2331_c0_g2~~TRINITY_DN2331_c0_g2_i2.p1  ORF type:complete len:300 (-),score=60.28 TRINITY_DN2331_c0_g2_i2:106-1005(-)
MELANLHKNRESNPKVLYASFVILWIPGMGAEVYWLIYATPMAHFVRQVVEAMHIVLLSVVFVGYGGSLLWQLRKSQVLSKKTTALKKLSSMLLVGGGIGLCICVIDFAFSANANVAVYSTFVMEVLLNVLFIAVLGPSIVIVPFSKDKKLRPFWKRENKDLSPNLRMNGDSLSDAFATPSTDVEVETTETTETTSTTASFTPSLSSSKLNTPNRSNPHIDRESLEMTTMEKGEKIDFETKRGSAECEKKQHEYEFTEKLEQVSVRLSQDLKAKSMTLQSFHSEETLGDSQIAINITID